MVVGSLVVAGGGGLEFQRLSRQPVKVQYYKLFCWPQAVEQLACNTVQLSGCVGHWT